ncbi:bifunctional acetate--CoA ligase family protein/GNAT family N-acetyltransferase [Ramlibacter sp. MAHUQ-53]|uniref:bifunctional acetate--CoA ligase family protein/GNAT family N-acetyltransferase n=1 Tax=unclassified Ramlibacter TaxID=2617605 RepID=UPI003631C8E1
MSIRHLEALFQPRAVAVIGASDRPGSVGAVVLRNVLQGGFAGPVWPVNARHDRVGGVRAWRDVDDLPGVPDLAVICTPAPTVPGLIAQLGRRGTRAAVVLSAGLKHAAEAGGPTLEQAMLDAARPHLLRILGPNCIGLLVPGAGLNASFAPSQAQAGSIAFVTQSGALATAMLDWASPRGIGFSHFISLGDSADVDFGDVLDYLATDPHTQSILMYVESVKHARKFMSAARAAARNKPVLVVKSGRVPDGAKAAASHTGALAGSDAVFEAAVHRAGMLRVDTLEALFDAAETLAHRRPLRGERLAIVTNGGGCGVLATDALVLGGGALATLSDATVAALDACLPGTWSRGNPVDIIGDAPTQRYEDALRILLNAPEADGVLFMHAPTALVPAPDIAVATLPLLREARKPVLAGWIGGQVVEPARALYAAGGIPCYGTPERATAAWLQQVRHARSQRLLTQLCPAQSSAACPDRERAAALLEAARAEGRRWLDAVEASEVLAAYGIPVTPTRAARDEDEAAALAGQVGFPVALKIRSPQVLHKSDVGGVVLGLRSPQEVFEAARAMRQRVLALLPQARIDGFTVQAMVERPLARELIVGVAADAVFGPVLLCGAGGVEVELRAQHAVALPPLNANLAQELLARTGLEPLLAAHRGRAASDREGVLRTLLQVSQLACDHPALAELDINPLLVDAQGVLAVDARIRVHLPGEPVAPLAITPYPQHLEDTLRLDGAALRVRPIRPEDGERLRDFYAEASPGDMRLRFFTARREVPASELARFSQIDYDREMTFIALAEGPQGGRMVAEVRAVCDPDNRQAEFAIQVAGDWQGRGLGRALLARMVDYLRARGTGELVGQCQGDNARMARLAMALGFEVGNGPADGLTDLRLDLRAVRG